MVYNFNKQSYKNESNNFSALKYFTCILNVAIRIIKTLC